METNIQDCKTIWFTILERSVNLQDYERAGEAVRQLRRLGVEVKFISPPKVAMEDEK